MMHGARIFHCGINPGLERLKDKKIVFGDHTGVDNLAFKIGIAFGDKRLSTARYLHQEKGGKDEV